MSAAPVPLEVRRALVGLTEGVTLNGAPATIMGALEDFATVAALPSGPAV